MTTRDPRRPPPTGPRPAHPGSHSAGQQIRQGGSELGMLEAESRGLQGVGNRALAGQQRVGLVRALRAGGVEGKGTGALGGPGVEHRLRPARLSDVIGQEQVLGPEGPLGAMLASGRLSSIIFWGPPGVGKTTIARLLADETDLAFVQISAIFSGVSDLRKVFDAARLRSKNGQGTLLFVDEIHRFNKAQQDAFLPHVEEGTVIFVGATTENPSFELNSALLSRARTYVLKRLGHEALRRIIDMALADREQGLGALELQLTDALCDRLSLMVGHSGVGKSALVNALLNEQRFTTSPLHGETRTIQSGQWNEFRDGNVFLIDTPGINEIDGEARERLARDVANRSDLVLFVIDGDITPGGIDLDSDGHPVFAYFVGGGPECGFAEVAYIALNGDPLSPPAGSASTGSAGAHPPSARSRCSPRSATRPRRSARACARPARRPGSRAPGERASRPARPGSR